MTTQAQKALRYAIASHTDKTIPVSAKVHLAIAHDIAGETAEAIEDGDDGATYTYPDGSTLTIDHDEAQAFFSDENLGKILTNKYTFN